MVSNSMSAEMNTHEAKIVTSPPSQEVTPEHVLTRRLVVEIPSDILPPLSEDRLLRQQDHLTTETIPEEPSDIYTLDTKALFTDEFGDPIIFDIKPRDVPAYAAEIAKRFFTEDVHVSKEAIINTVKTTGPSALFWFSPFPFEVKIVAYALYKLALQLGVSPIKDIKKMQEKREFNHLLQQVHQEHVGLPEEEIKELARRQYNQKKIGPLVKKLYDEHPEVVEQITDKLPGLNPGLVLLLYPWTKVDPEIIDEIAQIHEQVPEKPYRDVIQVVINEKVAQVNKVKNQMAKYSYIMLPGAIGGWALIAQEVAQLVDSQAVGGFTATLILPWIMRLYMRYKRIHQEVKAKYVDKYKQELIDRELQAIEQDRKEIEDMFIGGNHDE